jgi:hypothetical protein
MLICLHYTFYRRRLLPPGERTSRGSRAGVMQENIRGGEESSSPACCSCRVSLTPWFSPSSPTQQVSCDGTLEYFYIPQVPKMSFGEESTRTDQPDFPPQRFLTKAIQTARKSRQRRTKWWVGLKMDLKIFDLIFRPSTPSRQKVNVTF